MVVFNPNGERFLTFEEISTARELAVRCADVAEQQAEQAQLKTKQVQLQAELAQARASRLAALSRKARRGQATPEELHELGRLEDDSAAEAP